MTMKTNDNGVNRDMTEAEQAAHEAWAASEQAQAEANAQAAAAKAAARQAVLDKLGLTADEAAALLG
jgi:hypothetical protein